MNSKVLVTKNQDPWPYSIFVRFTENSNELDFENTHSIKLRDSHVFILTNTIQKIRINMLEYMEFEAVMYPNIKDCTIDFATTVCKYYIGIHHFLNRNVYYL